ncbi:hypothetical protein [Deinococcus radiotolerans]|uniref:Uncharacterized protein n=1 Tax=Deinococcus radiotolerans TaxID=1309407 RepID=A0ABQ2FGL1_9DEIO|nr:hypothetical protein [Deinococcus radiotolerans]GGK87362.1 hypothetical protein GCM10010844_02370 [Deinococcus radiotolerans]
MPRERETPINPPGFLATQDLKDRGWTPALIRRFLGEHDRTRPNGLRMGRRRLPPVKLYEEARVLDVERDDTFLAAQARAADARERAEQTRAARAQARQELLERAAGEYVPVIHPEPLRRGAVRKAREPYQGALDARLDVLRREIPRLTAWEEVTLAGLLRAQLDRALHAAYPWYPSPDAPDAAPVRPGAAKASDWRDWDWD